MGTQSKKDYKITALGRGFAVLEVCHARRAASIEDIVSETGLARTTVFRVAHTLTTLGYLERTDDGRYKLGLAFLKFSSEFYSLNELRGAAIHAMRQLHEKYGDTINLAVYDDFRIMYLDIVEGTNPFRMSATIGARIPVHSTALGKAIAAYLSEHDLQRALGYQSFTPFTEFTIKSLQDLKLQLLRIRHIGYAIDDQEMEVGARCVAAPIFDRMSAVVGAISISGPIHRFTNSVLAAIGSDVVSTSNMVSRWLGCPSSNLLVLPKGKV